MNDSLPLFAEPPTRGYQQVYQVRDNLFHGRSDYQEIEILDTVPFGRTLVLEGFAQTTEGDEFAYHEMLVHVPLFQHPNPRQVLVIGGGDGGSLRHVLMHPVERAVMVEIDGLVVQACRTYLPRLCAGAYDDSRAHLIIGDGAAFLRDTQERFDVIIVDGTDPIGAGEVLYSEDFFRSARNALAPGGLYAMQSGSPLLMTDELVMASQGLRAVFPDVRTYVGVVPLYPGVFWSYTMAARDGRIVPADPSTVSARFTASGVHADYYTPELHAAAFALPAWLRRVLEGNSAARHPIPGDQAR